MPGWTHDYCNSLLCAFSEVDLFLETVLEQWNCFNPCQRPLRFGPLTCSVISYVMLWCRTIVSYLTTLANGDHAMPEQCTLSSEASITLELMLTRIWFLLRPCVTNPYGTDGQTDKQRDKRPHCGQLEQPDKLTSRRWPLMSSSETRLRPEIWDHFKVEFHFNKVLFKGYRFRSD